MPKKVEKARPVSGKRPISGKSRKSSTGFHHYEDNSYEKQLNLEVANLRHMLNADFKNQRIVDLENKIRDNKRIVVNLMTENVFDLRFGQNEQPQEVKRIDRDELLM